MEKIIKTAMSKSRMVFDELYYEIEEAIVNSNFRNGMSYLQVLCVIVFENENNLLLVKSCKFNKGKIKVDKEFSKKLKYRKIRIRDFMPFLHWLIYNDYVYKNLYFNTGVILFKPCLIWTADLINNSIIKYNNKINFKSDGIIETILMVYNTQIEIIETLDKNWNEHRFFDTIINKYKENGIDLKANWNLVKEANIKWYKTHCEYQQQRQTETAPSEPLQELNTEWYIAYKNWYNNKDKTKAKKVKDKNKVLVDVNFDEIKNKVVL